jgi:hypothetical protein
MSRPSRNRGVPKGAGPGHAEHDQGVSGFAYDADGLEVLGLGPGLTVLMGLPPPTPSAMAFKMFDLDHDLGADHPHAHSVHDALLSC